MMLIVLIPGGRETRAFHCEVGEFFAREAEGVLKLGGT